MVAGRIKVIISQLCEIGLDEILEDCYGAGPVSTDELTELHDTFTTCKHHLLLHLSNEFVFGNAALRPLWAESLGRGRIQTLRP